MAIAMINIGLVILCFSGTLFFIMRYIPYEKYWSKVGSTYEQMIQLMGEPNSVEENEGIRKVYYDEITYVYDSIESNQVNRVVLENRNVRFGLFRIGVGTPEYLIRIIYSLKYEDQYCDQYNYGIVDGGASVTYEFDSNKNVKKIYLNDCLFYP